MSTRLFNKLFIFAPVLFALACSTLIPKPTPPAVDIEKEERAVYSFFLYDKGGPALILQDTFTSINEDDPKQSIDFIKSGLKGISKETINSYLARNAQPSQLSSDMNLGMDYVLLSADELAKISSQPNWGEILAEKYPGSNGYTIFSRVGFNNTLNQAVIYVGKVAGPMMGSGFYYLMEKKNGEWLLKEQINVWIS
jgi:hypothetical protein